jgi:hypothetical protein
MRDDDSQLRSWFHCMDPTLIVLSFVVNVDEVYTYNTAKRFCGSQTYASWPVLLWRITVNEEAYRSGDPRFVNAAEAALALGVTVPTLYAYVGRKGIRTQRVPGSRQTNY